MSGYWMILGLAVASVGLVDEWWGRALLAAGWAGWFRRLAPRRAARFMTGFLALFLLGSYPFKAPFHEGTVAAVRSSYLVVCAPGGCAMLYGRHPGVGLDDTVRFTGELRALEGYDNFDGTTLEDWARGRRIYWSVDPESCEVVRRGVSLRRAFWEHNERWGNGWANALLFGGGQDYDSGQRWLATAAGFHLSFVCGWLRKKLSRLFYPEAALRYTFTLFFLLAAVLRFPYAAVRLLTGMIAEMFFDDRRDRAGWQCAVLALAGPYRVKSLAYLVPMGLKVLGAYRERSTPLAARLYLLILQLRLSGSADLTDALLFPAIRRLSGYGWLAAALACIVPLRLPLAAVIGGLLARKEALFSLRLNGRLPLVLAGSALAALFHGLAGEKKRWLIRIALILALNHFQGLWKPYATVSFLDVGQGDCSLITFPHSTRGLLIDTGGSRWKDVAGDLVIPYLRAQGITAVDVIVSHDDWDHCGALSELQEHFPVGQVYREKQELLTIQGLTIFDPLYDVSYGEGNADSQVCWFRWDGFSFLYLGDIPKAAEEDIAARYSRLPVTVLKVSHHGSATGSSRHFLSTLRGRYALISAGRNNHYGHPDPGVAALLEDLGYEILSTQSDHAVQFVIFRGFMAVRTASGRWRFLPAGTKKV